MTYDNYQIFLKISLAIMVEIVDLTLRAVIDCLEIYAINSLIRKKNSRLISLCIYYINTIIIIIIINLYPIHSKKVT